MGLRKLLAQSCVLSADQRSNAPVPTALMLSSKMLSVQRVVLSETTENTGLNAGILLGVVVPNTTVSMPMISLPSALRTSKTWKKLKR
jgi:hypothetical protein